MLTEYLISNLILKVLLYISKLSACVSPLPTQPMFTNIENRNVQIFMTKHNVHIFQLHRFRIDVDTSVLYLLVTLVANILTTANFGRIREMRLLTGETRYARLAPPLCPNFHPLCNKLRYLQITNRS